MLSQTCLTNLFSYKQWIKNYEEASRKGKERMEKDFDMKWMILTLKRLDWEN